MKNRYRLLVDAGNVVIAYWASGINDQNYSTYPFDTIPEVPGAFEALRIFNELSDGGVRIVYKATPDATGNTLRWLEQRNFYSRTGIPRDRVFRTQSRDKTPFLEQPSGTHHGTNVVVDDRLEVLGHFVGKVPHLFLFRPQPEEIQAFTHTNAINHVTIVHTWGEIMSYLCSE